MTRSAADIRREFLEFFQQREHTIVPGCPVVPHDDPTLMFTNAGMNQFKPIFLGVQAPDVDKWHGATPGAATRAADTQLCIRAGGKHNDLDDVGHDTYHHTLFEMLGNWSFGDYFKRDAIRWAWELLTVVWGLDKRRLYATYFGGMKKGTEARRHEGTEGAQDSGGSGVSPVSSRSADVSSANEWEHEPDNEARDLWREVTDIDPSHIVPGNMKDNFWEMGDTGPCGPCSEIHIDLTPDMSGGPLVNAGKPEVIEIWNLVFIQFNRAPDGTLTPLPAKHVDTGMGFERIASVIQGMEAGRLGQFTNYDTDVFTPVFAAIQKITGAEAYAGLLESSGQGDNATDRAALMRDISYRVIADHIRALTFAIADGALPDKIGRGYVLRRILRRAVRYGWQYLGQKEPFLCKLVATLVDVMGEAFSQIMAKADHIVEVIREEEESFARTLERGILYWNAAAMRAAYRALKPGLTLILIPPFGGTGYSVIDESIFNGDPSQKFDLDGHYFMIETLNSNDVRSRVIEQPTISGEDAFKLHDTYGFPIDLTEIMANEKGLRVDIGEYERLMEEARERARGAQRDLGDPFDVLPEKRSSDDSLKYVEPYECMALLTSCANSQGGREHEPAKPGDVVYFTTNRTPFYAEQGGQVADRGLVRVENGDGVIEVTEVRRRGETIIHVGEVKHGAISVSAEVRMIVDAAHRRPTMQNHTATHVLNWALRETLGDHVDQKGSLVDPEKTRFDFSNPKPVSPEQVAEIERLCAEQIAADHAVFAEEADQAAARKVNSLRAVFGEKYPDRVRVVSIGVPVGDLLANPGSADWRQYSIEFCGGTHVQRTGEIEAFALVSEEAVAKGVRRVVGVTGEKAKLAVAAGREMLSRLEALLASPPAEAARQVNLAREELGAVQMRLTDRHKVLELLEKLADVARKQQEAQADAAADVALEAAERLLAGATKVALPGGDGETSVVVGEMPDVPSEQLKTAADMIKQKCGSAAVLLGVRAGEKAVLVAAMSGDLIKRGLKAGDLVKHAAKLVKGGGGGPPTMAQAGGKDPSKLEEALAAGKAWIAEKLGA